MHDQSRIPVLSAEAVSALSGPNHCGKALSKPESPPRGLQTDTLDPDCRGLGPGRPTLSLICLCLSPPPLSPSSQRRDTTEFGKRMWSGAQLTV